MIDLHNLIGDWDRILSDVFKDDGVILNLNRINSLYKDSPVKIYPEQDDVFKAFKECPFDKLSVVILLQDPYHDGSATGLATANRIGQDPLSPSLQVIKDTICREVYKGQEFNFDPTLIKWARQGVLMLNTALTVQAGKPQSHQSYWARFTQLVLQKLSDNSSGIVYFLWGRFADAYSMYIKSDSNVVLRCTHPVYAVYRGTAWECGHFNEANRYLKNYNNSTITW